jgi:septal ring factor EnvC (AmiA/AmiB activator)
MLLQLDCFFCSPQLEKKLLEEEEEIAEVRRDLNQTVDLLNQEQKKLLETEDKKAQVTAQYMSCYTHLAYQFICTCMK